MKTFLILLIISFGQISVQAQQIDLPVEFNKIIETKYQGWKLSAISDDIIKFFKENRPFEQPNFIKGDWNGDSKTDFAFLLEDKKDPEKKMMLVLIKAGVGFQDFTFQGNDCLMSQKKGTKVYDFEKEKSFSLKNDSIFSYFWEKGGSTFIWENGKFREILTSD